jgi:hypothetical protein
MAAPLFHPKAPPKAFLQQLLDILLHLPFRGRHHDADAIFKVATLKIEIQLSKAA